MTETGLNSALAHDPEATSVHQLDNRCLLRMSGYVRRPPAAAPPDLAPLEQAVALAKADEAKWKEAAVAGTVAPEVVGPAYDAAKARREQAERQLFEARQTAGLDDQRPDVKRIAPQRARVDDTRAAE